MILSVVGTVISDRRVGALSAQFLQVSIKAVEFGEKFASGKIAVEDADRVERDRVPRPDGFACLSEL